jgi:hypothetical protein
MKRYVIGGAWERSEERRSFGLKTLKGRKSLERPRRRCEDNNIKMELKETGWSAFKTIEIWTSVGHLLFHNN